MDLRFSPASRLVEAFPAGRFSLALWQELLDELAGAAAERAAQGIVIDGRGMSCPLQLADSLFLIQVIQRDAALRALRIAIVPGPDWAAKMPFVATAALNRGVPLQVFDSLEAAERWAQQGAAH